MLLGTASVNDLPSSDSSLAVENHRSNTPEPNSSRKADEIWAHGFPEPAGNSELFTFLWAETGGDEGAGRLERRDRQGVFREDELGVACRGIKFFCWAVIEGGRQGRRGGHAGGGAVAAKIAGLCSECAGQGNQSGKSVHKLFTAV